VIVFHAKKNFCTIGKMIPIQLVENLPKSHFTAVAFSWNSLFSAKKAHSVKSLIFC